MNTVGALSLCLAAVALAGVPLAAAEPGTAYARQEGDAWVLGNADLERRLALGPHLHTTALTNRLTGHRFDPESDEFAIGLSGQTAALTARDARPAGPPQVEDLPGGGKVLTVPLVCATAGVEVDVVYSLGDSDFYTRKQLRVRPGDQRVDWVEVERLRLSREGAPVRLQRFDQDPMPFPMQPWDVRIGRPVYAAGELFLGLEYPAAINAFDETGLVTLRHHPGRAGPLDSRRAVLGVAPDTPCNRLNDWFQRYIDRIRIRPVKRSVQWVAYFNTGVPDELVREKIAIAKDCFARRGVRLDCVLMDSGWSDPQSIMRISPLKPDRLGLVRDLARSELGAALGLHVITSGVKPMVDKDWLAAQGYDLVWHRSRRDGAYCLGDPRVQAEFEKNLVSYVRDYDVAADKFDWGFFACDQANHRGHRPGVEYGIEANTDGFIRTLEALRRAKPGIFLFNTGYYSPWWLMWYDAVFSAGADYNFQLTTSPGFATCAALGTWRDAVVRGNLVRWSPFFPLNSLMHVDPINHWWHEWDARYREPLDRFADYAVMSYLRGTQLTEVYLNLAALTADHRDVLAAVMNWAAANDDVLLAGTRFFGGDPLAGEVYGYSHVAADGRALVAVRNPHVEPADYVLRLDESTGFAPETLALAAQVIYPYQFVLGGGLSSGSELPLHLPSHETLVVRLEPAPRSAEPLLVGCRLERLGGEAGAAQFRLLGLPGTAALVTLGRGGDRTALGRALLSAGLAQRGEQFEVSFPGGPAKPLAVADSAAASEGGSLRLCFTATVAKGVRAAAVVWAETAGLQATATLDGQPAGVEAPHLQVEDSKDPARTYEGKLYAQRESYGTTAKGPWSLFRVPLAPGANRVEFHLRSTDLDRVTVSLKQPAPLGPVPARVVTVHATGLVQVATDLAEGPVVQLPYPEHQAAAGPQLPGNWLREWRDTVRAVPREALTLSGQRPAEWYSLAPGAKLFTDDGSTVTSLPAAIEGQRGLAGSRAALLAGSGTSLRLDQPARLVVAFGHEGGAAGWLPPLPGWQRGPGGFATTDPSAGTELCWRDFPAGNVDLFVGSRGAWAIVAVLPQPTDLARGATLAASSLHDGTHLASLATDGSPKTEWWSVNGLPQWLRLDLPAPTWLNRVDLTFYHADRRHYQYRIDTSADGQTWDLAVDATGNTALATAEGTVHPFPRRQARSLRITVTGSSEIAAHVAEVRLYDDPLASAGSAR